MCRGESNPLALKNRAVKEMREVTDVCRTKKKKSTSKTQSISAITLERLTNTSRSDFIDQ